MDQNNPIIPTNTTSNTPTTPAQTTIPRGASYDSISPEAQYNSSSAVNPLIHKPSAFQTGQNDWSKFNPQPESIPNDQGSADIYKYLDPKNYSGQKVSTPEPKKVPDFLNPQNQNVKTIVRTFKNDVEEAIKYNHVSSIDIAMAEQKKRQQQTIISELAPSKAPDINSFKIIIYTILGLIFLAGGGFAAYFIIGNGTTINNPISNSATGNQIISYNLLPTERRDEKKLETIDPTKLSVVLRNTIETTSLPPSSMEEIIITKTAQDTGKISLIKAKDFFSLNSINLPDEISRDLQDSYTYGIHSLGGNQPFLIIKTSSFQTGYPGMWSWQKGSLIQDMKKIFPINTSYLTPIASGTPQQKNYLPVFLDTVINNIDSFVLKDVYNRSVLAYTIFDKTMIIVSTSPQTISAIMNRLISVKSQQH
jgi:hypothetical protein